eukprot:TRINITY_DN17581_c0_g1_i1.p2 TRINITY_DN17581_c0_g1~~TRINITY_DN17581_c0_g1_i1.p2  ORF type:complete len:118 (-),score=14.51 TRINITY_DN17581_c0_g1_i1:398-751(-)
MMAFNNNRIFVYLSTLLVAVALSAPQSTALDGQWPAQRSNSLLVRATATEANYTRGTVIEVGPGVPAPVSPGDTVFFVEGKDSCGSGVSSAKALSLGCRVSVQSVIGYSFARFDPHK